MGQSVEDLLFIDRSVRRGRSVGTGLLVVGVVAASLAVLPSVASAAPSPTPFTSWGTLVTRQYQDILARAPQSSESRVWTLPLSRGTRTPGQLVDSLRRSDENLSNVDPVVRIYRAFLRRAPDAGGLRFWINRKRNVAPARTWKVSQIAEEFTKSNEFRTKYGALTNRQFVTQIYTDVLERAADPAGVNFWTNQLDTRRRTKATVMVGFSESNEYKNKQAENTDVMVAYAFLLGRAPTVAETTDWTTRQKNGTTHVVLLDELFWSAKYSERIRGTTPQAPGSPTGVAATATNGQATVTWTAPANDGGAAVTSYEITPYADGVAQTPVISNGHATSRALTNLGNGVSYRFRVAARNAVGTSSQSGQSAPVTTIGDAAAVATGAYHSCALMVGGGVKCWGMNAYGQLGVATSPDRTMPVSVSGITNATSIATGEFHSCAMLATGQVRCWGQNTYGKLGDGTSTERRTPVAVIGVTTAIAVAAGGSHSCALLSGGTVTCWGYNGSGQLGDGTTENRSAPVMVTGVTNATAISTGLNHTCARLANGQVKCWGNNLNGQLGDGTKNNRSTPVTVPGISSATAVSAGREHSCALLLGGQVRCWGANEYGRLGDGTETDRLAPVSVSGITTATAVAAGRNHSCALLSGGELRCWGSNYNGMLGDGTEIDRWVRVSVSGITTATAVAAGTGHTCAMVAGRAARCWGTNFDGQLGDGTTTHRPIPGFVFGL